MTKHIYVYFISNQGLGGGGSGLYSAFNHSWSYHRLQVGFGGVCRCMRGDLMWTCLVWAKQSMPDNFWVPSYWFNSATGEQKGITQTIYTDSEPPSWMPNSLMPSAKLRSKPPIFYVFGVTRSGIKPRSPRTPCGHSNHYAMRGRFHNRGITVLCTTMCH